MTKEEKLNRKERIWRREKEILLRELALKQDKKILKAKMKSKKLPSTSKLLILFLFINCSLIEIFTGWVTYHSFNIVQYTAMTPDFTPLVTLIGAVVAEVIGYAIYALKSAKENTVGGIVYEQAMLKANSFVENDAFEDVTTPKEASPIG